MSHIVIFDGLCNLCEATVKFIIKRDRQGKFKFAQAQSELGTKLLDEFQLNQEQLETVALIKNGRRYVKSTAALEIARDLDGLWFLLAGLKIIPLFLRDAVYAYIARNRTKWFGKKDACIMPTRDTEGRFL